MMQPYEIKTAYDKNQYGEITVSFPTLDTSRLTPHEKGMVVWSHHNVANDQKKQKSSEVVAMRQNLIAMARVVILDAQRIGDNILKSSMVKVVALNKDSLGEKEVALEYIQMAIDLDETNADNHSARGIMLNRAGKFQEAKIELMEAIDLAGSQIKPDDPERFKHQRFMGSATRNLAISVKELGDIALAVAMTYQAESIWLASEAGGLSAESHRKGIADMRAKWLAAANEA